MVHASPTLEGELLCPIEPYVSHRPFETTSDHPNTLIDGREVTDLMSTVSNSPVFDKGGMKQ